MGGGTLSSMVKSTTIANCGGLCSGKATASRVHLTQKSFSEHSSDGGQLLSAGLLGCSLSPYGIRPSRPCCWPAIDSERNRYTSRRSKAIVASRSHRKSERCLRVELSNESSPERDCSHIWRPGQSPNLGP